MYDSLRDVYEHPSQGESPLGATWKALYHTILSCPKCLAFWLGLVLTQDLIIAGLASMTMSLFDSLTHINTTN
jgi:hypothetical protein